MNDLQEDPIKVAEDIIAQGTKDLKFPSEAKNRIVNTLEAYHSSQKNYLKAKQEIEELKAKNKDEPNVVIESEVCWNLVNDEKKGPYCSRCWINKNILMPMKDHGSGIHTCIECSNSWNDGTYQGGEDDKGVQDLLSVD